MYDYMKHLRWAKLKVGVVITIALAIVFLAVMFAGSIEKMFYPKTFVYALFSDVKGLRPGAPVWFSGVEIGAVKSLTFEPGGYIKVGMAVDKTSLKYLKEDSTANILTLGLLGDKYIEISPGSKEAPQLRAGATISGSAEVEFQDIVRTSQESIARLNKFVDMLEKVLVEIETGKGTLSKLLTDAELYDSLKDATKGLSRLVGRIEAGKGTVGRLFKDETLYDNMASSAKDIRAFADSLKSSDGTLNRLIKDRELYDRFVKASRSLDEFTARLDESKGTLNKLIEDKSLYDNLDSVSRNLDDILQRVDKGEGVMGKLVRGDEMGDELVSTLRELNALIKDIQEHPRKYFKFSIF
jgi:phospholipid/cholesterol/gamma-HCH transport system substrate-binding protein